MATQRRLICVHGAGTGPSVFDEWSVDFPGWELEALDLLAGLDPATATMSEYAAAVVAATMQSTPQAAAVCGWSMGGLVALMAARLAPAHPAALVVIEPSLPAELKQPTHDVVPVTGTFDPADVYGRWPDDPPTRPDSRFALGERERGIPVPDVPCPLLVISGQTYSESRGRRVAEFYGGDLQEFPKLHHVALMRDTSVRRAIAGWLNRTVGRPS